MTAFSDFPAPAEHPAASGGRADPRLPGRYAGAFGVADRIRFGTRVEDVRPGWTVDGEPFDAVVVASGRFRKPRLPPGRRRASAASSCTRSTTRAPSRSATAPMLVYGNGISGLEIASDLAAARAGHLRLPQAALRDPEGRRRRLLRLAVVHAVRRARAARCCPRTSGAAGSASASCAWRATPPTSARPEPSEDLLVAGFSLCQDYLAAGARRQHRLPPGDRVDRGTRRHVLRRLDAAVDAIVCATGYDARPPVSLRDVRDCSDRARALPADLPPRPAGPRRRSASSSRRARTSRCWSSRRAGSSRSGAARSGSLPSRDAGAIAQPRPPLDAHNALALTLSEELGVAPDPLDWPELSEPLLFGPMLPPRYRLSGPGARPEARALF